MPERPARTHADCLDLWNAVERPSGGGGQNKSPADHLLELREKGQTRVLVFFDSQNCSVWALVGDRANT
ncbi:MAG: hypothetical protein M3320_02395, partial [Actinomycetota bacterium]|nr:hypothetical protein [Actinomycetota bacterium]